MTSLLRLVLALVKPLFEVESADARRSGHIDDPALVITALHRVLDAGAHAGLLPLGAAKLALKPRHGVTEFITFFSKGCNHMPYCYNGEILTALVEGPGIGREEIE